MVATLFYGERSSNYRAEELLVDAQGGAGGRAKGFHDGQLESRAVHAGGADGAGDGDGIAVCGGGRVLCEPRRHECARGGRVDGVGDDAGLLDCDWAEHGRDGVCGAADGGEESEGSGAVGGAGDLSGGDCFHTAEPYRDFLRATDFAVDGWFGRG